MNPRHVFVFLMLGITARAADAPAALPAPASASTAGSQDDTLKQTKWTDAVAAIVDDQVITLDDLKKQIDPIIEQISDQVNSQYGDDPAKAEQAFKDALTKMDLNKFAQDQLKSMVDRLLIIKAFTDGHNRVPDAYIERQFEDRMTSDFNDDRESFLKYLGQNGITELDFRKKIVEDDEVAYMVDQLTSSETGISPDRIKAYYEKNKESFHHPSSVTVREIRLEAVADAPVNDLAAKIVADARQPGGDFAALAAKYSADPLAREGTVPAITYTSDNKLAPAAQAAVFALEPGQISEPVSITDAKTNKTFVIIFKCESKSDAGYDGLDNPIVRQKIESDLAALDKNAAYDKWIQRLRSKSYIHYGLLGGA